MIFKHSCSFAIVGSRENGLNFIVDSVFLKIENTKFKIWDVWSQFNDHSKSTIWLHEINDFRQSIVQSHCPSHLLYFGLNKF
jgi:hypothetical protein